MMITSTQSRHRPSWERAIEAKITVFADEVLLAPSIRSDIQSVLDNKISERWRAITDSALVNSDFAGRTFRSVPTKLALVDTLGLQGYGHVTLWPLDSLLGSVFRTLEVNHAVAAPGTVNATASNVFSFAFNGTENSNWIEVALGHEQVAARHVGAVDLVLVGVQGHHADAVRQLRALGAKVSVVTWKAMLDLELRWAANEVYYLESFLSPPAE